MSKIKQKASKIPDLKTVGGVNRTKAVPGTIYFVPGTELSQFFAKYCICIGYCTLYTILG